MWLWVSQKLDVRQWGNCSLFAALAASCIIHLALFAFSPNFPAVRRYPGLLRVDLPVQISSVLPTDAALNLSLRQPAESTGGPFFKPAEIIELTPTPEEARQLSRSRVYLAVSALTQKPELLNPEWLDEAWKLPSQASGEVIVKLLIGADGTVEQVLPEEGMSTELADWLRLEMPKNVRFSPGQWQGLAVPSELRVKLKLGTLAEH